MKIGIIGSGNVGGALGTRWAELGHEVTFGSRNPNSDAMKQLVAGTGGKASAAMSADVARDNEVLLLSTPWPAAREVLASLGDLNGKTLIDADQPPAANPARAGTRHSHVGGRTGCGMGTWRKGGQSI